MVRSGPSLKAMTARRRCSTGSAHSCRGEIDMLTITPSASSHRVGDTVTVEADNLITAASTGDTLELYLFEAGGSTYSDVIASDTADASGNASFVDVKIPPFLTGPDHYFVVRHMISLNEDFSDPFDLLPTASAPATRLSLGLGMGL